MKQLIMVQLFTLMVASVSIPLQPYVKRLKMTRYTFVQTLASAMLTLLEIRPVIVQMGLLVFPVNIFLERIAVWTVVTMAFADLVFLQVAHRSTHIGLTQLAQGAISTVNVSQLGVASFVIQQLLYPPISRPMRRHLQPCLALAPLLQASLLM